MVVTNGMRDLLMVWLEEGGSVNGGRQIQERYMFVLSRTRGRVKIEQPEK